jgi:hypothetical protein
MLDFRVPFSLELKTPEMHFLKVQKKKKIHPKKHRQKEGVQKPPKKLKTPIKQGPGSSTVKFLAAGNPEKHRGNT